MDLINPLPRLSESNGAAMHGGQFAPAAHPHLTVELLKYLKVLFGHARLIIGLTVAMMALSVLYNEFVATRLYQAHATITPVPPDQDMSQIGGGLTDMLGSGGGGLASMLMGSSDNELVSQRDIAILNSFDFTNSLVKRYNVPPTCSAAEAAILRKRRPGRTTSGSMAGSRPATTTRAATWS